jgi:Sec-independent protein secretion pathway component TatC
MEYQTYNLLEPDLYKSFQFKQEEQTKILPVIIIAVTIIVVGYCFYYHYKIKRKKPIPNV